MSDAKKYRAELHEGDYAYVRDERGTEIATCYRDAARHSALIVDALNAASAPKIPFKDEWPSIRDQRRFEAACAAMQALIPVFDRWNDKSSTVPGPTSSGGDNAIAVQSVALSDALLAALDAERANV